MTSDAFPLSASICQQMGWRLQYSECDLVPATRSCRVNEGSRLLVLRHVGPPAMPSPPPVPTRAPLERLGSSDDLSPAPRARLERLSSSDDLLDDGVSAPASAFTFTIAGHRRGGSKDKAARGSPLIDDKDPPENHRRAVSPNSRRKMRGSASLEMVTIISSTSDREPEALPADSPALLLKLSVQRSIKFSRERNGAPVAKPGDWFARGWQGEIKVTTESGALVATVRYGSVNVDKQPCNVQVVAPEGTVLAQCDILPSEKLTAVSVGENTYAKCATTVKAGRRRADESVVNVIVTRVDGSG